MRPVFSSSAYTFPRQSPTKMRLFATSGEDSVGPIFVIQRGLPVPTERAATSPSSPGLVWLHSPRFMKLAKTVLRSTAGVAAVQRRVLKTQARRPLRVPSAKRLPELFERYRRP